MAHSRDSTGQAQALRRQLTVRILIALAVFGVLIAGLQWVERGVQESLAPQRKTETSPAPITAPPTQPAPAPEAAGSVVPKESAEPAAPEAGPPTTTAEAPARPDTVAKEPAGAAPYGRTDAAPFQSERVQSKAAASSPRATAPTQSPPAHAAKSAPPIKPGPHLQAGVFMQAGNAEALKAKLEAAGLPVYIESRVLVGPFQDRQEVEEAREKLKAMGIATVLLGK